MQKFHGARAARRPRALAESPLPQHWEAMNLAPDPSYDFDRAPDEWASGDEPITESQKAFLSDLAAKAGEPMSDEELDALTKAEASERIEELRAG